MHAVIIVGLIGAAGIAALFVTHKITVAGVEAELKTLEAKAQAATAVVKADVEAFIAAVRAKL